MKLVSPTFLSLFPCIAKVVATQVVLPERSSPSFAGSDNYFLHGVSSSEQARYISTLNTWGAKVLRLWGTPPTGRFIRLVFYISSQSTVTGLPDSCIKGSQTSSVPNFEDTIGSYQCKSLLLTDHHLK
jgi:mannan endo-1,4-beta-mannosidase